MRFAYTFGVLAALSTSGKCATGSQSSSALNAAASQSTLEIPADSVLLREENMANAAATVSDEDVSETKPRKRVRTRGRSSSNLADVDDNHDSLFHPGSETIWTDWRKAVDATSRNRFQRDSPSRTADFKAEQKRRNEIRRGKHSPSIPHPVEAEHTAHPHPSDPVPARLEHDSPSGSLPDGWVIKKDEKAGIYYYDTNTKTAHFELPEEQNQSNTLWSSIFNRQTLGTIMFGVASSALASLGALAFVAIFGLPFSGNYDPCSHQDLHHEEGRFYWWNSEEKYVTLGDDPTKRLPGMTWAKITCET